MAYSDSNWNARAISADLLHKRSSLRREDQISSVAFILSETFSPKMMMIDSPGNNSAAGQCFTYWHDLTFLHITTPPRPDSPYRRLFNYTRVSRGERRSVLCGLCLAKLCSAGGGLGTSKHCRASHLTLGGHVFRKSTWNAYPGPSLVSKMIIPKTTC